MPISPNAKKIVDKLYARYGSETGVLFGITNNRTGIECIVQATIEMITEHLTKLKEVR